MVPFLQSWSVFRLHKNAKTTFSNSSCFKRVFEKIRFCDGLGWRVTLTVEVKLCFQISLARCRRGFSYKIDNATVLFPPDKRMCCNFESCISTFVNRREWLYYKNPWNFKGANKSDKIYVTRPNPWHNLSFVLRLFTMHKLRNRNLAVGKIFVQQ